MSKLNVLYILYVAFHGNENVEVSDENPHLDATVYSA